MVRLCITGGIGAGKTAVLRLFAEKGAYCIDSDCIVHKLLTEKEILDRVVEVFTTDMLDAHKKIDRRRLADAAFRDRDTLNRLTNIIYPALRERIESFYTHASNKAHHHISDIFAVEVPLVFEAGWESLFDRIIVVESALSIRLARCQKKHMTTEEVMRRMQYQLTDERRRGKADYVIHNDGDLHELEKQVEDLYQTLIHN